MGEGGDVVEGNMVGGDETDERGEDQEEMEEELDEPEEGWMELENVRKEGGEAGEVAQGLGLGELTEDERLRLES